MHQVINKSLIVKYFSGLCNNQEKGMVEEWLKNEENELLMQQWLWEEWQNTTGEMPAVNALRLKKQLDQRIGVPQNKMNVQSRARRMYYGVAAAVIFLIATGGVLFFYLDRPAKMLLAKNMVYKDSVVNKEDKPFRTVLEDGSVVWLNAGATVYIADGFNKEDRRVKVKGEAFLKIKADAFRPFYADAGNITTRVLGTSFNIEAYPSEKEIRVSLLQGKVAVHSTDTACVLSAGQAALYKQHDGSMQVGSIATTDPSSWIKGKIVLNNIALPDALERLSRLYHIPVEYDHGLIRNRYINGEFDRDIFPEVLHSILFVHNLKFEALKNGHYRIY